MPTLNLKVNIPPGSRTDMSLLSNRTLRPKRTRRAAATAELAVCLPLIVLVVMGSIEAASMTFMRQALVQSAYETVKASVKTHGSQAEGLVRGQQVLAARNIQGHQFTINPTNVDDLDAGIPVTVTITAPGDANTIFPFGPFAGRQITAQATMLKE